MGGLVNITVVSVDSFRRAPLVVLLGEWTRLSGTGSMRWGSCLPWLDTGALGSSLGHDQPSLVRTSPAIGEKGVSKQRHRTRHWGPPPSSQNDIISSSMSMNPSDSGVFGVNMYADTDGRCWRRNPERVAWGLYTRRHAGTSFLPIWKSGIAPEINPQPMRETTPINGKS